MKTQNRIKNLKDPISFRKTASENYVDNLFKDPSTRKNTAHVNFNDKNLDNVRLVEVNSLPAVREHLTPKFYNDEAISHSVNESSFLSLDPEKKMKLDEQDSIILTSPVTSPKLIVEIRTKSYVGSLHEINRNRRDLS